MNKHQLWINERLAVERREREAREKMWQLLDSQLGHLVEADIVLETNPLDLGQFGTSHLEQAKILFPETQPGYGEAILKAIQALPDLLRCRVRDMMTDEERIKVGWLDDPYMHECRTCKRRVESPCNDRAGFQENGPWDGLCREALFPEEFIA